MNQIVNRLYRSSFVAGYKERLGEYDVAVFFGTAAVTFFFRTATATRTFVTLFVVFRGATAAVFSGKPWLLLLLFDENNPRCHLRSDAAESSAVVVLVVSSLVVVVVVAEYSM